MKQAIGLFLPFRIAGGFDACEAARDRVIGIPRQMDNAIAIDGDVERTGVRAIQRAYGRKNF
jgi:hypothetical protein